MESNSKKTQFNTKKCVYEEEDEKSEQWNKTRRKLEEQGRI